MSLELRRGLMATESIPKDAIIIAKRSANEAALMEVISAQDWSKSPKYMRKSEADLVSSVETAFRNNTSIVEFNAFKYFNGIRSFSQYAFRGCSNLESIELPDGINYAKVNLQAGMFMSCSKLSSVTLPDSLTELSREMFNGCIALSSIKIPASIKKLDQTAVFKGCTNLQEIDWNGAKPTSIGSEYFHSCYKLENITIPDSVTSIGGNCFQGTSIQSITIPDSVTSIGTTCFRDCKKLVSIQLPANNGFKTCSQYMFYNCTSLKSITIPDSVTSIDLNCFASCTSLAEVNMPNALISIGNNAFNKTKITSIQLTNTLKTLGNGALSYCASLQSITIPDSVTSMGTNCFTNCTSLTNAKVSANSNILSNAFSVCKNLSSITIPEGVTTIGDRAFAHTYNLLSLEIPSSITNIGNEVFVICDNKKIIMRSTQPDAITIGTNVINNTCFFYVPDEAYDAYIASSNWASYVNNIKKLSELPQ